MSVKYSVRDAVQHIARTIHLSQNAENGILPYFFIAGAGISVPNIPSAGGIIEVCKNQIKASMPEGEYQSLVDTLSADDPVVQYSRWMELAFPNKIDRSTFFRRQIKGAGITSANLLLAQILCSRKVASTVLTPNFDDILKQSMDLLGERNVLIAENAMDNLSITPYNQEELQIVHVHGTYRFYDCANLKNEIQAVTAQKGTLSSTQLIRNFLQVQVPIIIGYSGWDGDVIMTCLKERLSYPVPRNYIWVCYSQSDYDNLPMWLKDSEDVIFVLPDTSFENEASNSPCDEQCEEAVFRHEVTDSRRSSNVDAAGFFYKLISNLGISEPEVFASPADYYKKLSENILPKDQYAWHMRYWAEKMHRATAQTHPVEQAIRSLEGLLVSKDFSGIIRQIETLTSMDYEKSSEDADFVCSIMFPKILACDFGGNTSSDRCTLCLAMLQFQDAHIDHVKDRSILQARILKMLGGTSHYQTIAHKIHSISEKCENVTVDELYAWGDIIHDFSPEVQLIELDKLLLACEKTKNSNLVEQESIDMVAQLARFDRLLLLDSDEAVKQYFQLREGVCADDETYVQCLYGLNIAARMARKWDTAAIRLAKTVVSDLEELIDFCISTFGSVSKDGYIAHRCYSCISILLGSVSSALESVPNFINRVEYILDSLYPADKLKDVEIRDFLSLVACNFSTEVVSDQKKIHILQKMQQNCDTTSASGEADMFYFALKSAYVLSPNPTMYKVQFSIRELGDVEISEAIDDYINGNLSAAESRMAVQLNNPRKEIREQAAANLAYMVRRNEANNLLYSFRELADSAADNNATLQINILLYAAVNDNCSTDEYYERVWQDFCQLTPEKRQDASQWWENIALVGVAEHQRVQLLLQLAENRTELGAALNQVAMLEDSYY